jgi:hypothetical protein
MAGLMAFVFVIRLQLGVPTALSSWIMSAIEKKRGAANSIDRPKIVLLGGSATLFGVKASVLERELRIPVINGSLHAGLGMAYILREGRNLLKPGDTVVLFPEYELYGFGEKNRRDWAAITYLDFILSRDPNYYKSLSWHDQIEIGLMTPISRLFDGIKGRWTPVVLSVESQYNPYRSDALDSRGDMTGHRAEFRAAHSEDRDRRVCEVLCRGLNLDEEGFSLLKDFHQWAAKNRVRVLAGFPNMVHRMEYDNTVTDGVELNIRSFFEDMGVQVIGNVRAALLPQEDFFDTIYHPTEEASVHRSERLAMQMRPLFHVQDR